MKGGISLLRINILILLLCVTFNQLTGQQAAYTLSTYHAKADSIIGKKHLNFFFKKLQALASDTTGKAKVKILHIGDSHIQADMLTREIRHSFQQRYGNAGRGLIFPHRLARTNESFDFKSSTNREWEWTSLRNRKRNFEPGIAGYTLQTNENVSTVTFKFNDSDSIKLQPTSIQQIFRNDSLGLLALIQGAALNERKLIVLNHDTIYTTHFDKPLNEIHLKIPCNVLFDGLILENDTKGIRYDVVGVNGAHYVDYTTSKVFFRQIKLMQPDLIIVSLGTNEGVNQRITPESMHADVEKFVTQLRRADIRSDVLLLTPFDNYYRKRKPNPYLTIVSKGIVQASEQLSVACLDMYRITGGNGSALAWLRKGYLSHDRIHYTLSGYELQGKMIYNTLIKSYLSSKHD